MINCNDHSHRLHRFDRIKSISMLTLGILCTTVGAVMTEAAPGAVLDASSAIPNTGGIDSPSLIFNANTKFVEAEEAKRSVPVLISSGRRSNGEGLQHAMDGLNEALGETRRLLDGHEVNLKTNNNNNSNRNTQEENVMNVNRNDQEENDNESNNEHTSASENSHTKSSAWWERLYQGGPLYDQWTGKLIEETKEAEGEGISSRPVNRRSHSATVYNERNSNGNGNGNAHSNEWMVISGGFTDEDWNSFPVWAYDLSNGRSIGEIENEIAGDDPMDAELDGLDDEEGSSKKRMGPWVDLSQVSTTEDENSGSASSTGSGSSANSPPIGRVGHLSSVHNGCLYIFGGLTYRMGTFHVDYADDGIEDENSIAIWKACGLDELLGSADDVDGEADMGGLKWERVHAKVDSSPPIRPMDDERTTDGDSNEEENAGGHERRALRRNNNRRAHNTANSTKNTRETTSTRNTLLEPPDPSYTLPRGEAQGGHHPAEQSASDTSSGSISKDSFIFYGGMHHHQSLTETTSQTTTILGDVWKFEYESETLTLLSPYPPLPWQRDERNGSYPKARTAHAATIVNNQLIIHGGMRFDTDDDDENSQQTSSSSLSGSSSPSNTYATYKTSTASTWEPLSDIWVFDLQTLKWKERIIYPPLARSYHSLVGWGDKEKSDGTVAAFGGFQQDNNLPGETVAFVFKDLILSRPNETHWLKLQSPFGETASHWRTSSEYNARPGITNRLEHTAVLDEHGAMYIWGGRFQTVRQIVGLWRLDLFSEGEDAGNLKWEIAPPDGIDQYEAELQALHTFIATMMFMSLTISSLFSMMRRAGVEGEGEGGGGSRSIMGRRGLSRQVIDSLPLKRYEAHHPEVTDDGDVVEDVSLSRENSLDESSPTTNSSGLELEDNLECCAICLVPYEEGVSEVRTLPCGHVFDRECIDSWFADHTTCPSCRQNLSDEPLSIEEEPSTADIISEQYEFDPRFQFLTAFDSTSRRRHSHWGGYDGDPISGAGVEVSFQTGTEEMSDPIDDVGHHTHSIRPRFLGIRGLFSRRRHVGAMAVPGDDEEAVNNESIELV